MDLKNIVLFEHHDGVRFVLERSMRKFHDALQISSSHWKNEVMTLLDGSKVDLLITELSRINPDGLEISCYARKHHPDLAIIWITVLGCNEFRNQGESLGIFMCIEKPLEIDAFRHDVLEALDIN